MSESLELRPLLKGEMAIRIIYLGHFLSGKSDSGRKKVEFSLKFCEDQHAWTHSRPPQVSKGAVPEEPGKTPWN
jgi:hypothetical protein